MNKHVRINKQSFRPQAKRTKSKPHIDVVHEIEDIDTGNYFFEVRFSTRGSRQEKILIRRSRIRHLGEVQDQLMDKGAHLYFGTKAAAPDIETALTAPPVKGMIQKTTRTGWHDDSFVWQGGTHGSKHGKLSFLMEDKADPDELQSGELKEWKAGLEKPCESSKILVFALALGFAAPFLKFVSPNEGATFYIWGKTTTGKTLAKRALMSIFRRAKENDLMTFDHTVTKLDEEAEAYNDLVLVLNESERLKKNHEARAEVMREIAYKISGGTGRQRSKIAKRNFDLKNRKWLVLCIASGETTANTLDRNEGEEIRLVDIPVPKAQAGGIFSDHEPDVTDYVSAGKAMARATEQTILKNYGKAFPQFMDAVCADLDAIVKRVNRNVSLFMKNVAPNADAKTSRLVEKFGIIYAGAIEACRLGVAPWTEERARVAIVHVCRLALEGIAKESAVEAALKKLQGTCQRSEQFPVVEKGESLSPNLVGRVKGFRRAGVRQFVAVSPEDLEQIIGGKEITAKVLKRLEDKGIIWMESGKRVRKVQVCGFGPAIRNRWYCFWYDDLIKLKNV
jgi:hypothetical protein